VSKLVGSYDISGRAILEYLVHRDKVITGNSVPKHKNTGIALIGNWHPNSD
jgi:hypothetical protein